ncbi:MAG: hypothetical protein ACJ79L_05950 [Anaeromyxobacteraceae bacterium]
MRSTVRLATLLAAALAAHPRGAAAQPAPAPFTLVVDAQDANALPLDPMWGWQQTHAGEPPDPDVLCFQSCDDFSCCSSDPVTFDVAVLPNDAICSLGAEHDIHGHANWRAATYRGRLDFTELSSDFDYNFTLVPRDRRGLVSADGAPIETIGVEFDGRETAFHFTTPWWLEWNAAVAAGGTAARDLIAALPGENGAVTGLLGLDCEHACATELHPAYGFVVHGRDLPDDDVWPLFARNWGNEGFCSHLQHELATSVVTVRIPWRQGATAVTVKGGPAGTQFRANLPAPGSTVRITAVPGDGVYVALPVRSALGLAPPRIHGEVHLSWNGGALAGAAPAGAGAASGVRAAALEPPEAEELLGEVYDALPDAVRSAIFQALGSVPAPDIIPVPFVAAEAAAAPRPGRGGAPATRQRAAPEKEAQDVLQAMALCDALGGAVPGFPAAFCAPVPPREERDDDRGHGRDVRGHGGDARGHGRGARGHGDGSR